MMFTQFSQGLQNMVPSVLASNFRMLRSTHANALCFQLLSLQFAGAQAAELLQDPLARTIDHGHVHCRHKEHWPCFWGPYARPHADLQHRAGCITAGRSPAPPPSSILRSEQQLLMPDRTSTPEDS